MLAEQFECLDRSWDADNHSVPTASDEVTPASDCAVNDEEEIGRFEFISHRDQAERSGIASSLSERSRRSYFNTLEGIEEDDPALDPTSSIFEPYKWARATFRRLDEEGIRRERAGIVFKNLNVSGLGAALQLQNTVGSVLLAPLRPENYISLARSAPKRHILQSFDGLVKSGEMLMVLGKPGSGCSTFLKTVCGELHGLLVHKESVIHYNGIPIERMHKEFKGECVYNQEVDKHFPHLTVGQTLEFAAAARTPSTRPSGLSRMEFVKHVTQVVMTVLGLSHTYNTKGR